MANQPVTAQELARLANYVYNTTPLVTEKGWPHLMSDEEVRKPRNIATLAQHLLHVVETFGYTCDLAAAEYAIRQEAGLIAA